MEEVHTPKKRGMKVSVKTYQDDYMGLDLSNQGIKNLSKSLFQLTFLKELNLKGNDLETIPEEIYLLKNLEILNLSRNKLKYIPAKIGKMINLKELYLSDNLISNIPMELGCLYNLTIFEIHNNSLVNPFNTLYKENKLIQYCREHNTSYASPSDRTWIDIVMKKNVKEEGYTFGTYNILNNFYALKMMYPPSWILNPDYRKENILHDIQSYNVDVLCLQEIETFNYQEFYKDQLDLRCDYSSIFCPKSRAKTIADNKSVDGCAIFWKKTKFNIINNFVIDFLAKISQDPRLSKNQELIARYGRKDNIALIAILESTLGEQFIVINVHVYWDPEYKDIKLIQIVVLLEEIEKIKKLYRNAKIVLMGDFNSLRDSSVYSLITEGKLDKNDFEEANYNLTFEPKLGTKFQDAYSGEDMDFTNFTPQFKGVIDYIFYSEGLQAVSILSPIESEYADRVVGLPNVHFPSDHIFISAKFVSSKK
ncbi:putative glucose-repressible alcohol dehydrogenase transcriptional effector like protein [Nosema granulosis]|uniref:poly(A)-specific ribonuclease n=1 Tax=Nosema granulosis TaxID=83296 RepID=A0A9P6GZ63_9MICR|nr:putative glucose-repressible alcohol dehydrogenase transcriptional effector like protein [Nosema granulosis]